MWRMATGLDNAELEGQRMKEKNPFAELLNSELQKNSQLRPKLEKRAKGFFFLHSETL